MSRSSSRTLIFILSVVVLSSVVATAGYFYGEIESSPAPAISKITKPVVLQPLKRPDANQALTALFALPASENKVKTAKDKLASLWFERSFSDGSNKYHTVFIKNQMVDPETNEVYGSHADAPFISAVVYKLTERKWELLSKQTDIGVFGSWGDAPPVKQAQQLQLATGNTALLLDISYSGQGYTNSGKTIFAYHDNSWKLLGYLQTGGNNEGVCDDEAKEDEFLSACWQFEGKVSLSQNTEEDIYPDVVVSRSGTMSDDSGKIVPVENSVYSFNGEEYLVEEDEMD